MMNLTLKCLNPTQAAMPVIEDVQLQMRICINGHYFEFSNVSDNAGFHVNSWGTATENGMQATQALEQTQEAVTEAYEIQKAEQVQTQALMLTSAQALPQTQAAMAQTQGQASTAMPTSPQIPSQAATVSPALGTASDPSTGIRQSPSLPQPQSPVQPATLPQLQAPVPSPFWQAYGAFIEDRGQVNGWTPSTYRKFEAIRRLLADFEIHIAGKTGATGATAGLLCQATEATGQTAGQTAGQTSLPVPPLCFDHFDTAGLNTYIDFLVNTKNMRNSTVYNQLGFLKWFLRWSLTKGCHHCRDFEWFKPKLRKSGKKVIFLTQEELHRLKTFEIPKRKKYLERVRDVFLFSCFTGLRYSDVFNLKKSDIKDKRIEITTIKTADSLVIELNNHSRAILDKYRHEHLDGNKALPVISNQRMNVYLKELGELVGIDAPVHKTYFKGNRRIDQVIPKYRLLASHVGRRTFVCNALALGIPPQVVMKWTGHSDYASMKPYIDIADDVKASAMCRFNRISR